MTHRKSESSAAGATSIADLERGSAWKYVGYPGFSRFMASSNDCFALRRFTSLNVRVLLKLQNNVVELERRLDEMDNFSMNLPPHEGGCASLRLDANSPREELLDEIEVALEKYNSRLASFLQIHERPVPSLEQVRNIQTWLANYPNAIEDPEQEFVSHEKDLFAVKHARRTHFGKWMESIGLYNLAGFRGAGSKASGKYYDRNAWKSLGGFWLMVCLLGMLLGPLWALPFALDRAVRLSVVTAFAVAFSMIAIIGTTFKASHRGALVAGYFAQLILVLGLTPAWQSSTDIGNSSALFPASTTTFATITAPTSVITQVNTVTATPSENSPSNSNVSPAASAHTSSNSRLSDGAIIGITVGVSTAVLCIALSALVWYRRRRRAMSSILGYAEAKAPSELPDSDRKKREMGHPAPTIRLFSPENEIVASSSSTPYSPRPYDEDESRSLDETDEAYEYGGVTSAGGVITFTSVKGSKGKGRLADSNSPLSASSNLAPNSASPGTTSQWGRRRFSASASPQSNISWGTTLHPDSVI